MNKKKGVFFGAILIDIFLMCLGYVVFYGRAFDEATSIILTWIVIIGGTFMMITTIGLAVVIPRKRRIKFRKKKNKQEELSEFKIVEDEQPELPEFKTVEDENTTVELERTTSKSGITTIRRVVTKGELDEIKEHVTDGKSNFKDEIKEVIDERAKKVEEVVDDLISKTEKDEKHIEEIRPKMRKDEKQTSQNEKQTRMSVQDKIYKYMKEHPTARPGDVRKAVKCKLSTAKKYRSKWLKR